ncbi:MAG: ABC transporter permease [Proteobacteria bacterium]|nr:ABC transporter permease [Pseudomonadota bacterium]
MDGYLDNIDFEVLMETVLLSLRVSTSAVVIATVLALPIAAIIATTNFSGRKLIIIILNTLMGLPPVVVGLLIYLLLSRAGPLGAFGILFTPTAMVIAQTVLLIPIIAGLARQIIETLWLDYSEQLISLGASKASIVSALLIDTRFSLIIITLAALGRALSEVGAVMIVGGNIDGVTRVMTTAISLETSKGDLSQAILLGIVLLLTVFSLNLIVFFTKEYIERKN